MKRKIFLILLLIIIINVYKVTNDAIIIPNTSIRLRIIPNSNSEEDINIKEKVKTYLEKDIYVLTKDIDNIEKARNIIRTNIPNIEKNIAHIFDTNNYQMSYDVNFGYNYFPEKQYDGVNYEEGYYESLVISIGEAKGDNWWCVLFPNLCLIDKNNKHVYKLYLEEMINKYSKK